MPKKKKLEPLILKKELLLVVKEEPTELNTSIEFASICRACLNSSGNQVSLFDPFQHSTVAALMNVIADVKIIEGDGLPDSICKRCLRELETSVNFRERCKKSNNCLLQAVNGISELETDYLENEHGPESEIKNEKSDDGVEDGRMAEIHFNDCVSPLKKESQAVGKLPQVKSVQCHDCGGIFKSKCKLRVHWKNTHNTYVCPSCKRIFKSVLAFNKHQKKSKICINPKEIVVVGVGKKRVFKCAHSHCHYETRVASTIRLHTFIHNGKKPFKCGSCSMSFNQISSLSAHKERTHSINVLKVTCQYCGKVVLGRNRIYKHLKSHSNQRYQCDICKKYVKSKSSLVCHLQRHSGVKSFTCELCAASYYTLAELCNHKRFKHTGSSTWYSCKICDFKSKRKRTLLSHEIKHSGSNIPCQKCGIFFESASKLQSHFTIHVSGKKFSCPICSHMFHRKDSVRNHIRAKHKDQIVKSENNTNLLQLKQELPVVHHLQDNQ